MNLKLVIFSLLIIVEVKAQHPKTFYANETEVVALFFPDPIQQAVVGSSDFTFSYNKENPQHIGLLQGAKGRQSNLLVITSAHEVYSYKLKYKSKLDTLNYFITRNENIGLEKPLQISFAKISTSLLNDSIIAKTLKTKIENPVSHYRKFSEFQLKHNRNSLKRKRKKGVVLHLNDLIYDRTEVYALIEIKNRSGIDFELDYLKVFKVNGNNRKKSSYQKIEIEPIYRYSLPKIIKDGESREFVLTVPKFTMGDQEKLLLELKESKGNRTIMLTFH